MSGCFAAFLRSSQRWPAGIQKTPSAVYSSRSSSTDCLAASFGMKYSESVSSTNRANSLWRTMKVSETYLRKIRPRTTCLYWAESILPRSSSAASHSVASRLFAAWDFFFGGTQILRSRAVRISSCQ